jgi:hypothetical protein
MRLIACSAMRDINRSSAWSVSVKKYGSHKSGRGDEHTVAKPCFSLRSTTLGILSAARESDAALPALPSSTAHALSLRAGCAQSLPPSWVQCLARREACTVHLASQGTGRRFYGASGHHTWQRSQGLRSGFRSSAIHAAVHGVLAQFSPPSPYH